MSRVAKKSVDKDEQEGSMELAVAPRTHGMIGVTSSESLNQDKNARCPRRIQVTAILREIYRASWSSIHN